MMRRASVLLGPNLVEYHEWHLHEPLLINYEGWRILDNVKMTPGEAFFWDLGGTGRHLDPIIDDPRLTHRQRVCRLYRWACREHRMWISKVHSAKYNIGAKVIRQRFEKYRYVTEPAMCDMMVRETQKYLRETCNIMYMRNDVRNPNAAQCTTHPMFHPDNAQVYDVWIPVETFWYDDAKLHRYSAHHPMMSSSWEMHERYGDIFSLGYIERIFLVLSTFFALYCACFWGAVFHTYGEEDPNFKIVNDYYSLDLRRTIEYEERLRRNVYSTSLMGHNWEAILGRTYPVKGYIKWWATGADETRELPQDPRYKDHPKRDYTPIGPGPNKDFNLYLY